MKITDEMLYEYVPTALDKHIDDILEASPGEHVFSENFLKKMDKVVLSHAYEECTARVGKNRRIRLILSRAAIIVLVISICCFGVAMSVEAYRNQIFTFFRNIYEDFTEIIISSDKESVDDNTEKNFTAADITNIPEGFITAISEDSSAHSFRQYENDIGDFICLDQVPISDTDSSQSFLFDSEDTICETIDINGYEGYLYRKEDGSRCDIWWNTKDYMFTLTTTLPTQDAISIARSVYVEP